MVTLITWKHIIPLIAGHDGTFRKRRVLGPFLRNGIEILECMYVFVVQLSWNPFIYRWLMWLWLCWWRGGPFGKRNGRIWWCRGGPGGLGGACYVTCFKFVSFWIVYESTSVAIDWRHVFCIATCFAAISSCSRSASNIDASCRNV